MRHVDLEHLIGELAREDHVCAIGRVVGVVDSLTRHLERVDQLHGVGVAKVQSLERLGNHDGVPAVGRDIWIVDGPFGRDGLDSLQRDGIDDIDTARIGHQRAVEVILASLPT